MKSKPRKQKPGIPRSGESTPTRLHKLEGQVLNVEIRLGGFQAAIQLITAALNKIARTQVILDAKITRLVSLMETLSLLDKKTSIDVSEFDADVLRDLMATVAAELDESGEIDDEQDDDDEESEPVIHLDDDDDVTVKDVAHVDETVTEIEGLLKQVAGLIGEIE